MPAAMWETDYAHDIRAHRHRCRFCNRIVNTGERVLMAKVAPHTSHVLHVACGDQQHGSGPWTWRDFLAYEGAAFLQSQGWSKAALDPRARLTGSWDRQADGSYLPRLDDDCSKPEQVRQRMIAEYTGALAELDAQRVATEKLQQRRQAWGQRHAVAV